MEADAGPAKEPFVRNQISAQTVHPWLMVSGTVAPVRDRGLGRGTGVGCASTGGEARAMAGTSGEKTTAAWIEAGEATRGKASGAKAGLGESPGLGENPEPVRKAIFPEGTRLFFFSLLCFWVF